MKALILNSGIGSRMGKLTAHQPKCMVELSSRETILSRQLHQLAEIGIDEVIITTGPFEKELVRYAEGLELPIHLIFVKNSDYESTNYIYSIYCARHHLKGNILLLHGDLVFENEVLDRLLFSKESCMAVSFSSPLPEKDFKAILHGNRVVAVGTNLFEQAVAAQPLYYLKEADWDVWLSRIVRFCENGRRDCYAENALNEVSDDCIIRAVDIDSLFCQEVDNQTDLVMARTKLTEIERRIVYMSFSTDVLHGGHIALIKKACRMGKLIVGVLSDRAVASYRRFPLVPFDERKNLFANLRGVYKVVEQKTLSYRDNLEKYHPDYVIHGDDWKEGVQKSVRDEVITVLATYGGRLIEYPYAKDIKYRQLDDRMRREASLPDFRRAQLRKLLDMKGIINAIEVHSGLTGLIAEKTSVYQDGCARQFDAMWVSSLCDSTAKGKPDIELVDMTSRFRTIDDVMEVTTKPLIFDGDTGGLKEHFVYTVRTLERMGVSMVIIEDKVGLKKNSLFGTSAGQVQDTIDHFCEKIAAGKKALRTSDFMICARIESLILEMGMEDAMNRAIAYVKAGADAIMIHSRKEDPAEIFDFAQNFRAKDSKTPLVVVPTSFNSVTEEEFQQSGINVVIYANQLTRTGFPAMQKAARSILENHRAKECDEFCMSFKDIIRLIPEEI